jgi:hypothetical protein
VLDRIWRQVTPPESVREALRAIYLWWAVEANPASTPQQPQMQPDFLTESPINWERKEIRTLEELMLTAYPTNTDTCLRYATGLSDSCSRQMDAAPNGATPRWCCCVTYARPIARRRP